MRKISRLIETLLTYMFDFITMVIVKKNRSDVDKTLVIVRLDLIGDFILWIDAAKELRRLYPYNNIVLVANRIWSDLASLLPYWDEIIPVDRDKFSKNPVYRFNILKQIRMLGAETIIQPTFSRVFCHGDSIVRASCAQKKIGSVGDLSNMTTWQKKIADKWYSHLIEATKEPLMELQRNAEFLRGLGHLEFSADMPVLSSLSNVSFNLISGEYFIIFPGSFKDIRRWPKERYGMLLSILSEKEMGLAVLCGSNEERDLCDSVIRSSGKFAINLAGETSLPELVEVIRKAKFLIGNETSAVHIAAAVGTPSVCILGGGHYGRFLPYSVSAARKAPIAVIHRMNCFNCNWQCTLIQKNDVILPCVLYVTVEEVVAAVQSIWKPYR